MHNELRYQAKTHVISEKLSKEKIKILHLLPQFFLFFIFLCKNNKTCFDRKETEPKPCMCGKIKPVLKERGLELPRQKSSRPMCFLCHLQIVLVEVFQDNTRKIMGIKQ